MMSTISNEEMQEQIRRKYAAAITSQTCCGSRSSASQAVTGGLYPAAETDGLSPELVAASLGCGNPTALTPLYAGEVVLDLGSGAGLDVILSARRVGPAGKAYGLDMTDEMLAAANANKEKLGVGNIEFLKGKIEAIPLPDNSVDVVISNCVINLSVDKDAVFREIHRVLKPGGRMAVSDIVTLKPLPEWLQKNLAAWTGCMAGALSIDDFKTKLTAAGFVAPELEVIRIYEPVDLGFNPLETKDAIGSAFIRAQKAKKLLHAGIDYLIQTATPANFPALHELLAISDLTAAGVDPATGVYFVAIQQERLLGMIGIEVYGSASLVRSFAVSPAARKSGVGNALLQHALHYLKTSGLPEVFLLTNTAEDYFSRQGFTKIDRQEIPAVVLESSALGNSCPASSICMKLQ